MIIKEGEGKKCEDTVKERIDSFLSKIMAKFPVLVRKWEKKASILTFEDTFWADPPKDPFSVKVALVTTGGVHAKDDEPFDMKDREGDPSYRAISSDTPRDELTITHNYYDHRDALKDPGVVFPLDVLVDMGKAGEVGSVNSLHYSFMGHVTGKHLPTLIEQSAPEVAAALRKDGVGAVLLSPA